MTHRRPSFGRKLLLVVFGLGVVVVGLAVLEGALALFGAGEEDLYDDPFVGFVPGSDLFAKKTLANGQAVYATRTAKLAFFNPQEFPAAKGSDTYRVFTLGGSTTAGRPYDDYVSFARWLERYLDAAEPSRRHQVINAGAVSYASYRIALLMEELVRYSPDLFVIYTGHNEFLEERTYSHILHQPAAVKGLGQWLSGFRFASLLRRAVRRAEDVQESGLSAEVRTRLDVWKGLEAFQRDDELRGSILRHFAFNLERMVDLAQDHGVEVVLVKPVSNLKDFSPFKSQHRPDLSHQDRARFRRLQDDGRSRLAAGDPQGALEVLEQARELDPDYAELHFRIGEAELKKGDLKAAARSFHRAKELDVAPLRALESLADQVAETATRRGLVLIDLPALLAADCQERFGHTLLGNEYLLDHVHPDMATHSRIAQEVLLVLADRGHVDLEPAWSEAKRRAIYDQVIASLSPTYYARRDLNLAKVLGWAGKLEEAEAPLMRAAQALDGELELHLHLGTLWQQTGRLEAAARELERAVEIDPASPEAHFNLGVTYGHLGRPRDGIEALNRAVELRPDYAEAHYNLGLLQSRAAAPEAAISSLSRALELRPGTAEIHRSLAGAYRLAGRQAEAASALEESLRLAPGSAAARADRGIQLARQGQLKEAAAELEQALALDPDYAEAHYNLGVLSAQSGNPEAAIAAYERTLELDPAHPVAHNNLGILYANRGDLERASQRLNRALEIDPDYADAYLNLGVVYDAAGKPQEAVRALERALELRPQDPRIHLALGLLYFAQGQVEKSRPHLEAAQRGGETIPAEVAVKL